MKLTYGEKEKIRRQLYKQDKLKQKMEEEEKKKYPGIHGLLGEEKIFQYFIFDKDVDKNIIINNDKIAIDYELNSYFNNEQTPDLCTPYGMISGNNYQLMQTKNKEEINNNNDNIEHIKIERYFDYDIDTITSLRCKKCGRYGHTKSNCIKEFNYCYICLRHGHIKKDCPLYIKCYKCLKYGHKIQYCTTEISEPLCQKCNMSIHKREECFKHPDDITKRDLEKYNLKCEFCGSKDHLICPYSKREDYNIIYEKKDKDTDKDKNINDNSHKLFCPWCGGGHLRIDCPEKKDKKNYSETSEIKSFNTDTNNNSGVNNNNIKDDFWGNDNETIPNDKNDTDKKKEDKSDSNIKIDYDSFRSWGTKSVSTDCVSNYKNNYNKYNYNNNKNRFNNYKNDNNNNNNDWDYNRYKEKKNYNNYNKDERNTYNTYNSNKSMNLKEEEEEDYNNDEKNYKQYTNSNNYNFNNDSKKNNKLYKDSYYKKNNHNDLYESYKNLRRKRNMNNNNQ